eukprot:3744601-Lingulodinium_polyedra.AAC.1
MKAAPLGQGEGADAPDARDEDVGADVLQGELLVGAVDALLAVDLLGVFGPDLMHGRACPELFEALAAHVLSGLED